MLTAIRRPTFDEMNLSTGKRARLHRLTYRNGPANGTLTMLRHRDDALEVAGRMHDLMKGYGQ